MTQGETGRGWGLQGREGPGAEGGGEEGRSVIGRGGRGTPCGALVWGACGCGCGCRGGRGEGEGKEGDGEQGIRAKIVRCCSRKGARWRVCRG